MLYIEWQIRSLEYILLHKYSKPFFLHSFTDQCSSYNPLYYYSVYRKCCLKKPD